MGTNEDSTQAGSGRPLRGRVRRGATLAATLFLAVVAAGCFADAADAPQQGGEEVAAAEAPADSTPVPPPEPPRPETTWVRLTALGSDAPRIRRRSFRSTGDGFRVIIELRDATTTLNPGRVTVNVLSPKTSLPIRTLEAVIWPQMRVRADTAFISTDPGEYALYILHDYGVREWSVVAEAPRIREEPR